MKKLLAVLFGFGLIFSFASDGSAADLIIGQGPTITGVDPHWHDSGGNSAVASHMFERLIELTPDAKRVPGLATEWGPVSDTVWEVKLRKGVTFHDGTPLTAKDVVFSFTRVMEGVPNSPGPYTGATKGIEKIEAKDDYTIVIHTKGVYPNLAVDIQDLFIVSEKHGKGAKTADYTRGTAMIGSGPYKFVEWIPDDRVKMTRNDNYWGGKPTWDNVTVKFVKSGPARVAALLAGDVDAIDTVPPTDIERLKTDSRVTLYTTWSSRFFTVYPGFPQDKLDPNFFRKADGSPMDSNPFRDIRIRKALSLAVNRQAIVDKVFQGQAVVANQLIVDTGFGAVPGYNMSQYDPEEAKKLIKEAGYPNGFRMTIHTSTDRWLNSVKLVQALAQMYTRVGLPTKVETMPHTVFSKRRSKLHFPLFLASWGNSEVSANGVLSPLLRTYDKKKRHGRANRTRYSNPELDKLISAAESEINLEKQEKLWQQALKVAMDDYALIPLTFWVVNYASKPSMEVTPRFDVTLSAMQVKPK